MKSKQLVIRVTEEQYNSIQSKASLQGIKPSQLARDLLFPGEDKTIIYRAILDLRYKYLSLKLNTNERTIKVRADMKIALLDEILQELPSLNN